MSFNITAIFPVLNRPKNIEPMINSLVKNTPMDRIELLFITGDDCQEEIQEIKRVIPSATIEIVPQDKVSWAKRINHGIEYSNTHFKFSEPAPWILCCADDVVFHPDWFQEAQNTSLNFDGIIGTNDLGHPATIGGWHSTHPLVSRNYATTQGTMDEPTKFCHEGYHHNYVDVEFIHTSMKRGKWKHNPKCIIEHIHPAWNKATWDDIYEKGQANFGTDSHLWTARKQRFSL